MAFIQWRDGFSTGIAKFDEQHQKLVAMLNDLYLAMSEGREAETLGRILTDLIAYTETHFADEEEMMNRYGYPSLADHKQEHRELAVRVGALAADFETDKSVLSEQAAVFLKEWLKKHIIGSDLKYGTYFRSKGLR